MIVSERWPAFRRTMIRGGKRRWKGLSMAVTALASAAPAATHDSEMASLLFTDPILSEYLKLHAEGFERDSEGILWLENLLLSSGL